MNFQDIISNTWSKEEIALLEELYGVTLLEAQKQFLAKGFNRTAKAISKKKSKLRAKNNIDNKKSLCANTTIDNQIHIPLSSEYIETIKSAPIGNKTTLVVPDAHISPKQDLSRFISLGKLANHRKPDNIVFMGDFLNMDSLSSWDIGKEASHGKKYKEDIKAGIEAIKLFTRQLDNSYKPNLVFLGGNHSQGRIEKYIESHPMLRDHMNLEEDLRLKEFGFTYIPYKKFYEIEGTLFTHAIMNAANSPISSKNIAPLISSLVAKSIVVGHHHRLVQENYFRFGANDIQQILVSGLFSSETESYAEDAANAYWRGCCLLTHWKYGRFDVEQISIERLRELYRPT